MSGSPSGEAAGVQVGGELARDLAEVQRLENSVRQSIRLSRQQRVLGQVLRGPGAGGHHARHARQRVRIFGQQGQVGAALGDGLDQVEQPHRRLQRRGRLPRGARAAGNSASTRRRLASGRLRTRWLPIRVSARRSGSSASSPKMTDLSGQLALFVGFFLVGRIGGRRGSSASPMPTRRNTLRKVRETKARCAASVSSEFAGLHAQRRRQRGAQGGVAGQQVGLLVFAVLQRVLGAAQEAVGGLQPLRVGFGQQAGGAFGVQRFEQAAALQGRHASASDQLGQLDHGIRSRGCRRRPA